MKTMRAIVDDLRKQGVTWRLYDGEVFSCGRDTIMTPAVRAELWPRYPELKAFLLENREYWFDEIPNVIPFSVYVARRDRKRAAERRAQYGEYYNDGGSAA